MTSLATYVDQWSFNISNSEWKKWPLVSKVRAYMMELFFEEGYNYYVIPFWPYCTYLEDGKSMKDIGTNRMPVAGTWVIDKWQEMRLESQCIKDHKGIGKPLKGFKQGSKCIWLLCGQ